MSSREHSRTTKPSPRAPFRSQPPTAGTPGDAVTVAAGERKRLAAGNYGAVSVAEGGLLELVGAAFQFASLSLPSGASLLVELPSGGATLRVAGDLTLAGSLGALAGSLKLFTVFALTESNILLSGSFSGQLVAPNARVVAGDTGQRGYLGRVLASEIYLQNGVSLSVPPENPVVHLYHFGFPGDVGAGTVPLREAIAGETRVTGGDVISDLPDPVYAFDNSLTYRWQLDGELTTENTTLKSVDRGRPYLLVDSGGSDLPRLVPSPGVTATLNLDGLWLGSFNSIDGRLVLDERAPESPPFKGADWGKVTLTRCTLDPGGTRADHDPIASVVLVIRGHVEELVIENSIVSAILVDEDYPNARVDRITIHNSIVDGRLNVIGDRRVALRAPLSDVTLRGVTVIGDLLVERLDAKNTLVTGALQVVNTQNSCFSFSAAALAEPTDTERNLPKLYQVPRLAHVYDSYFSSLRYGDPTYCQLSAVAPDALQAGAEGGSEMGVFSYLHRPIRLASILTKLDEFAPVGVLPQFVVQQPLR